MTSPVAGQKPVRDRKPWTWYPGHHGNWINQEEGEDGEVAGRLEMSKANLEPKFTDSTVFCLFWTILLGRESLSCRFWLFWEYLFCICVAVWISTGFVCPGDKLYLLNSAIWNFNLLWMKVNLEPFKRVLAHNSLWNYILFKTAWKWLNVSLCVQTCFVLIIPAMWISL